MHRALWRAERIARFVTSMTTAAASRKIVFGKMDRRVFPLDKNLRV